MGVFPWLLASLILGFCLGLYWELFRFLRQVIPHKSVAVALEDLVFFLGCAFAFWLISFAFGLGQIRWFSVCATALGFLLYLLTLGKWIFAATGRILRLIKRLFGFLKRRLLAPLWLLLVWLAAPLLSLFSRCRTVLKQALLTRRVRVLLRRASRGFQK